MANRENLSTCPICGYNDTAGDAEALQMAMDEHMRTVHNMSLTPQEAATDLKPVGDANNGPHEGLTPLEFGAAETVVRNRQ